MEKEITTSAAYKAAEVYEQFTVSGLFRYWTPIFLNKVSPKSGDVVLDIACGTGIVARSVLPLVKPEGKVYALDINPAMLEVGCRYYPELCPEIDWHEGRAESLPFPDQSFDLVLCQQGMQFFKDRQAAVREIYRVLRKNARVGIEVWQTLDKHPFYQEYYEVISSVLNVPLADITVSFALGDPKELEDLLISAGFDQVKVEPNFQHGYFTDRDRFVELTFMAAAAIIPTFSQLDPSTKNELQGQIKQRVSGLIDHHTKDGVLAIPLHANIAQGVRE